MSIVDNFFNKKHASQSVSPKKKVDKEQVRKALNLFNELSDRSEDVDVFNRRRGESVVEWEQRLRDDDRRNKYRQQYEPLYADQYKKADVHEKYSEDIVEIENKVQARESYESTTRLDFDWTSGSEEFSNIESNYEMEDVVIKDNDLQHAVDHNIITSQKAMELKEKGTVEGVKSSWFTSPKEVD